MDIEAIPERFFIDLAVGVMPFADICALHKLDPTVISQHEDDPGFKQRVGLAQQAVDDDGRAFRARCRSIINRSVAKMESLMSDPQTPASTRLDAFKTLAKYGELEPEKKDAGGGPSGPQLVFNIYGPDGKPLIEQTFAGAEDAEIIEGAEDRADPPALPPPALLTQVSGFF